MAAKMTKTMQLRILSLCTDVLYHRRNSYVYKEQKAFEKLQAYLDKYGITTGAGEAVEQARQHLSKTSAAAIMNGITA